jgi:carbohydrate kinase (thermoresistant glucokinase family)
VKIVVMGVTGCGKTTVGIALAQKIGVTFIDSDGLHSASNKRKMASGTPLNDSDRAPWLRAVSEVLLNHESVVAACSALKKSYRDMIIAEAPTSIFIHLSGSKELISGRLRERSHHFMPIELLDSQFQTLENLSQTENGKSIDISKPVDEIVMEIIAWIEHPRSTN